MGSDSERSLGAAHTRDGAAGEDGGNEGNGDKGVGPVNVQAISPAVKDGAVSGVGDSLDPDCVGSAREAADAVDAQIRVDIGTSPMRFEEEEASRPEGCRIDLFGSKSLLSSDNNPTDGNGEPLSPGPSPNLASDKGSPVKGSPGKGPGKGLVKGKGPPPGKGTPSKETSEVEPASPEASPSKGKGKGPPLPSPGKGSPGPAPSKGKGPNGEDGKGKGKKGPPPPAAAKGPEPKGASKGAPKGGKATTTAAKSKAVPKAFGETPFGRRIHWVQPHYDLIDGASVFGELQSGVEFDSELLKAMLSNEKPVFERRRAITRKPTGLAVFDASRAQNMAIVLQKLKASPEACCKCLVDLDFATPCLTTDDIELLMTVLPTQEESRKLLEHVNAIDQLRDVEQKVMPFCTLPRALARLKLMRSALSHGGTYSALLDRCRTLRTAAEEVRGSTQLRELLNMILRVGNFINHGVQEAQEGTVRAFAIESLNTLGSFKTGAVSTLHFLCLSMRSADQSFFKAFKAGLGNVPVAAREKTGMLRSGVEAFGKEVEFAKQQAKQLLDGNSGEAESSNSERPSSEERMNSLTDELSAELEGLNQELEQALQQCTDTQKYFSISERAQANLPPAEQFFGHISSFIDALGAAWQEIERNPAKWQQFAAAAGSGTSKAKRMSLPGTLLPGSDSESGGGERPGTDDSGADNPRPRAQTLSFLERPQLEPTSETEQPSPSQAVLERPKRTSSRAVRRRGVSFATLPVEAVADGDFQDIHGGGSSSSCAPPPGSPKEDDGEPSEPGRGDDSRKGAGRGAPGKLSARRPVPVQAPAPSDTGIAPVPAPGARSRSGSRSSSKEPTGRLDGQGKAALVPVGSSTRGAKWYAPNRQNPLEPSEKLSEVSNTAKAREPGADAQSGDSGPRMTAASMSAAAAAVVAHDSEAAKGLTPGQAKLERVATESEKFTRPPLQGPQPTEAQLKKDFLAEISAFKFTQHIQANAVQHNTTPSATAVAAPAPLPAASLPHVHLGPEAGVTVTASAEDAASIDATSTPAGEAAAAETGPKAVLGCSTPEPIASAPAPVTSATLAGSVSAGESSAPDTSPSDETIPCAAAIVLAASADTSIGSAAEETVLMSGQATVTGTTTEESMTVDLASGGSSAVRVVETHTEAGVACSADASADPADGAAEAQLELNLHDCDSPQPLLSRADSVFSLSTTSPSSLSGLISPCRDVGRLPELPELGVLDQGSAGRPSAGQTEPNVSPCT